MNYKILVVLACIAAIISVFLVSEATAGVLAIGFACLFGIFARIAQAEAHFERDKPSSPAANPDAFLRQYAEKKGE